MAYMGTRWGGISSPVTRVEYATKDRVDQLADTVNRLVDLSNDAQTREVKLVQKVGNMEARLEWLTNEYNYGAGSVADRLNNVESLAEYLYERERIRAASGKKRLRVTVCAGNKEVRIKR
jgi:hypothetical protein